MDVFLFRALAPGAAITLASVGFLVLAPFIIYLMARWRSNREGVIDPHLGLKFALHYFALAAGQLLLAGVALLIYMLISPGTADKGTSGYRAAVGFMMPAGMVLAIHIVLLKRTNDAVHSLVRRLFLGYNLLVTGLVAFVALVLGFQMLMTKGSTGGVGHAAGAMIVVYGTAWAMLGFKFGQLVLGLAPSVHTQIDMPMVPPVMPTPPSQSSTGLPALGGGSFPPIDQK
jgi:hypothetical protein